jgi:large subunit ribosomal protein L18
MDIKKKIEKRKRRHRRVRGKISGTAKVPRLCVFRSNNHIYAQLINDKKAVVLALATDLELDKKTKEKQPEKNTKETKPLSRKVLVAFKVGKLIAKKASELKIEKIVFDKAGYKYHGRVKALADGARLGGLKF